MTVEGSGCHESQTAQASRYESQGMILAASIGEEGRPVIATSRKMCRTARV